MIPIAEFVKILGNLDIDGDFISEFGAKFGHVVSDYKRLFEKIAQSDGGQNKILKILEYFWLSHSFVEVIDYGSMTFDDNWYKPLATQKALLLWDLEDLLEKLKSQTKKSKENGNLFEEFGEKFLLHRSYFNPWVTEFSFEDWTQKIDRLLKLKKDIGNFGKETNYLWYVILETKYKKDAASGAWEVSQLTSYCERLNDYWVAKYAVVITKNEFKSTYKTNIWDFCRKRVIANNPFYLSLLTIEKIKEFLQNEWCYENMWFDEFIERSFIERLK